MKKVFLAAAMLGVGSTGALATLVVDDFTTLDTGVGYVSSPPGCLGGAAPPQGSTGSTSMGPRVANVSRTGGTGCAQFSISQLEPLATLALGNGSQPTSGSASIQWTPGNASTFSQSLLQHHFLDFMYGVDLGTQIAGPNQSTVSFQFCLTNNTCMSATQTFVGQIFPAQMLTWFFTNFTNYAAFWADLQAGNLVSFVQLTLTGQNDQDLFIDNIVIGQVPEPATVVLVGSALAGLVLLRRKRA
jgi:hypothetical protein